ncbi:unnamed protein product [Closterium sp. NIES-65]|nr:unnamed protein product [Closterium sp. NIES-65]
MSFPNCRDLYLAPLRGLVAALQRPHHRLSAAPLPPLAAPSPPFLGPSAALPGPAEQPSRRHHRAAKLPSRLSRRAASAAEPPSRPAAEPPSRQATDLPSRAATEPPSRRAAPQPRRHTHCSHGPVPAGLPRPASPARVLTFDAEGRAVNFDVWVDDLQLFLQCDRADGPSLFDLTSGASPSLAADADATVRSQGAPPPPSCPLLPLLLRPTSLVLSRSVRRLPLAGDAAQGRARGARALEELSGAVEAAVEAAEGVGVAVGVVVGVGALVVAVEAEEEAVVAVQAEVAEVEAVVEVVAAEVELIKAALRRGSAPVVFLNFLFMLWVAAPAFLTMYVRSTFESLQAFLARLTAGWY